MGENYSVVLLPITEWLKSTQLHFRLDLLGGVFLPIKEGQRSSQDLTSGLGWSPRQENQLAKFTELVQEVERIIVILQWQPQSLHLGMALGMCVEPPVRLDMVTGQAPMNWKSRHMIACLITDRQENSSSGREKTELRSTELRSLCQV